MILTHISTYLLIECFKSQTDFCIGFLLRIPFRWFLYILVSPNICFTKSEIHKFMTPKPSIQLKSVLIIYRHIKGIYMSYIVYIKYPRYQIYNFSSALHLYLVDESGDSYQSLPSLFH